MGINIHTRMRSAACSALRWDCGVVLVPDCVASLYGDDRHVLGLQSNARYLSRVLTRAQCREEVRESGAAA